MKKVISILLLLGTVALFYSCVSEEDDIFDKTAAERLNEASALYSSRLTASPNGWAMQYYPTNDSEEPNGVGYLLLVRFNKDHTANVSGNVWPYWITQTNTQTQQSEDVPAYRREYRSDTSLWEVITDNGPVLSFNTYNTAMHYFSDPDFHETGTGFGGDYEFIVTDAPEDATYMMLKGKKRGTYNLLTPIEEGVDYVDYLNDIRDFSVSVFSPTAPTGCLIHIGDSTYVMDDALNGLPSIYPEGKDKIAYENFNPFLITKRGNEYYLRFRDAFDRPDMNGVLQDLHYEKDNDRFVCVENEQFTIVPHDPSEFLYNSIVGGHTYSINREAPSDQISDKMLGYMTDAYNGLVSVNKQFVFPELSFHLGADGKMIWSYKYQPGTAAKDVEYGYSFNYNGNTITFSYEGALAENGENIKNRVDAISTLLTSVLSQGFTVSSYKTAFDLSKIKLTSTTDPDLWFVINY